MWAEVVIAFAILIAIMGLLAIATPKRLMGWIASANLHARLIPIALIRIVLGLALWRIADEVAHPNAFRVLAVMMIVAGLTVPIMGRERVRRLVDWWMLRPPALIRGWGVLAAAFGLYLLQSLG